MALVALDTNQVIQIGLESAGFPIHRQNSDVVNARRFSQHYGILAVSCSSIFQDIQRIELVGKELRIDKPKILDLLMTLRWFKTYAKEEELAGVFHISEVTFRKRIWKYSKAIQKLRETKVSVLNVAHIYFLVSDLTSLRSNSFQDCLESARK
jgi:hypothetical protein